MEPYGYRVRNELSWHLGGWKKCEGPPKCEHCAGTIRARASLKRREKPARKAGREEERLSG